MALSDLLPGQATSSVRRGNRLERARGDVFKHNRPGQVRCEADNPVGYDADDPQRALSIEGHTIREGVSWEGDADGIGQRASRRHVIPGGTTCKRFIDEKVLAVG